MKTCRTGPEHKEVYNGELVYFRSMIIRKPEYYYKNIIGPRLYIDIKGGTEDRRQTDPKIVRVYDEGYIEE